MHLTPMTRDPNVAADWLSRFEGAGLDGVIAKPEESAYEPGKRAMIKIKHVRTADCVVAGFRWHKAGRDERVGSLLLGLYDAKGALHHVGVTSAFTMACAASSSTSSRRFASARWTITPGASGPRRTTRTDAHARRAEPVERRQGPVVGTAADRARLRGQVRPHAGRSRFRHAAVFQRWRPDRQPADCRYDQLEVTTPYELESVFGAR